MIEIIKDSNALKILNYLNNNNNPKIRASKIGREEGINYANTLKCLCELEKLNLVKKEKINQKSRIWIITNKGRNILNLLLELRRKL